VHSKAAHHRFFRLPQIFPLNCCRELQSFGGSSSEAGFIFSGPPFFFAQSKPSVARDYDSLCLPERAHLVFPQFLLLLLESVPLLLIKPLPLFRFLTLPCSKNSKLLRFYFTSSNAFFPLPRRHVLQNLATHSAIGFLPESRMSLRSGLLGLKLSVLTEGRNPYPLHRVSDFSHRRFGILFSDPPRS